MVCSEVRTALTVVVGGETGESEVVERATKVWAVALAAGFAVDLVAVVEAVFGAALPAAAATAEECTLRFFFAVFLADGEAALDLAVVDVSPNKNTPVNKTADKKVKKRRVMN